MTWHQAGRSGNEATKHPHWFLNGKVEGHQPVIGICTFGGVASRSKQATPTPGSGWGSEKDEGGTGGVSGTILYHLHGESRARSAGCVEGRVDRA